jgi:hypothetical protein
MILMRWLLQYSAAASSTVGPAVSDLMPPNSGQSMLEPITTHLSSKPMGQLLNSSQNSLGLAYRHGHILEAGKVVRAAAAAAIAAHDYEKAFE